MQRFAFAGRSCVLTGAGGIGAAPALELAGRRMVLALIDRDGEGLERVAAMARERGAREVTTYVLDGRRWRPRSCPGSAVPNF
jgi:short-subunit dehydrogenase